jgi:hypothetical protein
LKYFFFENIIFETKIQFSLLVEGHLLSYSTKFWFISPVFLIKNQAMEATWNLMSCVIGNIAQVVSNRSDVLDISGIGVHPPITWEIIARKSLPTRVKPKKFRLKTSREGVGSA